MFKQLLNTMIRCFKGDNMLKIRALLYWLIVISIMLVSLWPMTIISENNNVSRSDDPVPISGLPNDMWPGFRGGPTKTGNTTATGPSYFHELWRANANLEYSSPAVMYDQIYVVCRTVVNCYNMSGGIVWTYNAGSDYGSPLVHNGRVYFASGNGDLFCLDANSTGSGTTTRYWLYNPPGVTRSASSPVTDGSKVYYSTQHISGLHAVWITNGTKAWNASLGGSTVTESSPAVSNGMVYCGGGFSGGSGVTGTDNLYCYNSSSGQLNWTFTTTDDVVSAPAIEYGRVYFGSYDNIFPKDIPISVKWMDNL